jgi:16S rRNA processing protein RimM
MSKLIHVGTIAGAHGIRGELKLRSLTENPRDIVLYQPLTDAKGAREFHLTITGTAKEQLIVRIKGIEDRTQAELLGKIALYAPRERIPESDDDDEVLLEDLIGLQVRLLNGMVYGQVCAVMNYGAGDILEIMPEAGRKTELYSFTLANFPELDIDAHYIVLSPPEISDATREK